MVCWINMGRNQTCLVWANDVIELIHLSIYNRCKLYTYHHLWEQEMLGLPTKYFYVLYTLAFPNFRSIPS